jgi:hypothetical protein
MMRQYFLFIVTILFLSLIATTAFAAPLVALADNNINNNNTAIADKGKVSEKGCELDSAKNQVKHVIYIQFDNLHFVRDNPNVPSDLEQMPHLLTFMKQNGTLLTNHHTPLISHTGTDILTSLTGLYGDRMGVPVSNSFRYFNPNGTTNPAVSFAYWTDPIFDPSTPTPNDKNYNMLTEDGHNTPAPWVPFTRAGCDFGATATANAVLENIATDIPTVFGSNSTQAKAVKANPDQAFADYVGIAVHCAMGSNLCTEANGAKPDVLPDEPGGYLNFAALYGHKYVAPQINNSGNMTDLDGETIMDRKGHIGFPGFDGMSASVSLSYVAAMQEHGVPITYAYISDAHDAHPEGPAYGPGNAGYVAALAAYDNAFAKFFKRLENDGMDKTNTLFVFTSDEGDHFVGGSPSPPDCDGVNISCTYEKIGEINTNMAGLLATQQGITTPFNVHADSAPTVYITGNPARTDATTRSFEQATSKLTAINPITDKTDKIAAYIADPVEMKLLHMVTSDPARTPTFTLFADPNYYLFHGASNCASPCVTENPGFAWNHGDVQSDITTTWLGMVGPGVTNKGVDNVTWSDHTDIRPTIMMLVGLKDDYSHDGRALIEELEEWAIPTAIIAKTKDSTETASGIAKKNQNNDNNDDNNSKSFLKLALMYKQIDAPLGKLSMASLNISTEALKSNSTGDKTYKDLENQIISFTDERNTLKEKMIVLLENAEFNGKPVDEKEAQTLVDQAKDLLHRVLSLANPSSQATLSVNAISHADNKQIAGVWVTVRNTSDGNLVYSGYTPFTFNGTQGKSYTLTVANYDGKIFQHWQDDNSTSNSRIVRLLATHDSTFTAVYDTGHSLRGFTPLSYHAKAEQQQPDLTVNAMTTEGNKTLQMWAIIDPQSSITSLSTTTTNSSNGATTTTYKVYATNGYKDLVFDHWSDDGSKDRVRNITISQATTIIAYYKIAIPSETLTVEFHHDDCHLSSAGCGIGSINCSGGEPSTTLAPITPALYFKVSKNLISVASDAVKGKWSALIPGAADAFGDIGNFTSLSSDGTKFVSHATWKGIEGTGKLVDHSVAICGPTKDIGSATATFSGQCGGTEVRFETTNGVKAIIQGKVTCTTS